MSVLTVFLRFLTCSSSKLAMDTLGPSGCLPRFAGVSITSFMKVRRWSPLNSDSGMCANRGIM